MISQRCPKCNSPRIRSGYRHTPIWSKLLFRYNLLCDNCNWEFKGFAVPGTVSSKSKPSKRKPPQPAADKKDSPETGKENSQTILEDQTIQTRKKVKVRLRA